MRRSTLVLMGAVAATVAGCVPKTVTLQEKADTNAMLIGYHQIEAEEAAVIRQATLFPYHFQRASASLNDLGRRDLMILARHWRDAPGDAPESIKVQRGDAGENLYRARVREVRSMFASIGISEGTILENGLPGGDGATAGRVLNVQDRVPQNIESGSMMGGSR